MQSREGSVLAEQTVLSFASAPPSSVCSPVLPAWVCEGRGGETGFAMNQKTQLQFNLGIAPNQANLATSFNPTRPSPVTIEKTRTNTIGMSHTPIGDFKAVSPERLALAMKMARRNVRIRSPPASEDEGGCPTCTCRVDHVCREESRGETVWSNETRPSPCDRPATPTKIPPEPPASPQVEAIARDIEKLKIDLRKQMAKLNKAKPKALVLEWKAPKTPVLSDRVYWQEPYDEGKERKQQRHEEQQARNARMLYDLSQQVKSLQRQFRKCNQPSAQPVVVQKLAAAQRAALRTLQGYSSSQRRWGYPIPPELSVLVQQLALLSSQLGGGPNTELNTSLRQHMTSLDEREKSPRSSPSPKKKFVWTREAVYGSKCAPKKTGGVLHSSSQLQYCGRHLNHSTLTDQTFSSARRQQPPHLYTPSPRTYHPPRSRSSPRLRPSTHATPQSATHKNRGKRGVQWSAVKPPPGKKKASRKNKKTVLVESACKENKLSSLSPVGSPCSPSPICTQPSDDVSTTLAQHSQQLQSLREEISEKLLELKVGRREAAIGSNLDTSAPPPPRLSMPEESQSVESLNPRVASMMSRLEVLEAEEEMIRQRWKTISYEDPLTTKPVVTHKSDSLNSSTSQCSVCGYVLPVLSSESCSSIQQYRQQYSHYLDCTGLSTQGGFDPWKMAESIADKLLDELFEGVAEEVGQVCDGCVDELFGSEFVRPPELLTTAP